MGASMKKDARGVFPTVRKSCSQAWASVSKLSLLQRGR